MKDEKNRDKASTPLSRAGQDGKGQGYPHPCPPPEYKGMELMRFPGSRSAFSVQRTAFTLVELLVVLIIIGILMGLLLPMVSKMRTKAYATGVQAQIASLRQAIDQYYADFRAYPGPVSNQVMGTKPTQPAAAGTPSDFIFDTATTIPVTPTPSANLVMNLTGPENLVLGLIGGLTYQTATSATYPNAGVNYDPSLVGNGAYSLNQGLPKRFGTYIDTRDLSPTFIATKNGFYGDGIVPIGTMADSPVPEILDRFPNKMPILYIRATVGGTMYPGSATFADDVNPVVINAAYPSYGSDTGQAGYVGPGGNAPATPMTRYAQYDISQIIAYTQLYGGKCIGEGKTAVQNAGPNTGPYTHGLETVGIGTSYGTTSAVLSSNDTTGTYIYPYPAYPYFKDPNSPAYNVGPPVVLPYARAKDTYILISAGADRIYGTADDITSFGDVRP
ncbi:MAG TPA: prepilin-type N-terminal cleavage/methylation domain-containing protein [Tepidisphaeraceae bacterium]|jgi:prepilin-type N-terminal cleavage/methylation domain-containing protein